MWDSSRGTAGDNTASKDLAAPVVLRGAIALSAGDGFQREVDCWRRLDVQVLGKEGGSGDVL
jgi:hypothetical protein